MCLVSDLQLCTQLCAPYITLFVNVTHLEPHMLGVKCIE